MESVFEVIKKKIAERLASGNDDAFYVLDIDDVKMKYRKWMEKIPRVTPFYAVKCNDDPLVLQTLAAQGTGFDCASKKEVKQVLDLGVSPERIIYSHTAKQISHLKYGAENLVMKVTFDSPAELLKIREFHSNAQVVLRIRFDAENSIICLGLKFGCDPISEAPALIKLCRDLKMNLVGINFHVGSGTKDAEIFERALAAVRVLFDVAKDFGFDLSFVDIGGGFMGSDMSLLDKYAHSINLGVEKYFADSKITIISEPGRYFVESAFTLAVQIILKRITPDGHIHYYLNDGIYMSFLISYIYEEKPEFKIIRKSGSSVGAKELPSTLWGSSCNSRDKIFVGVIPELEMEDWLVFSNMGAYTTTVSTKFNGFEVGSTLPIGV